VRNTRASKTPSFDARIRDVLAAAAVALVLLLLNTTGPLDQLLWTAQARIHSFEPSGEIVFVGADGEFGNHRFPQRRRELAHALDRLADTQAARVYVNFTFERPSDGAADAELRAAMQRLGNRLYLVQSYETDVNGVDRRHETIPAIAGDIRQVGEATYFNYLGYAWDMPFTMAGHGSTLPSLPASRLAPSTRPSPSPGPSRRDLPRSACG
jgi:CHASE2 domain-containing sensor protein